MVRSRGRAGGSAPVVEFRHGLVAELSHSCGMCRTFAGSVLCMPAEDSLRDSREDLLNVRGARGKDDRLRDHRRALGRYGETLALDHLRARGFSVLARNYRTRRGEIDLIAFDGETLVFAQVKTQQIERSRTRMWESPLRWLSARQMARYRLVAEAWLADERYTRPSAQSMRFDAIGVIVDAKGTVVDLKHVEGSE
jgi:putative endonuclease